MQRRKNFDPKIEYIRQTFVKESDLLKTIAEFLHNTNRAINIGPDEAKILQLLIKLANAKLIVEIGTLAGYSSISMAEILPEDGKIYTIEKDPKTYAIAQQFFSSYEKNHLIESICGDAREILSSLSNKMPFDLIFIDADKKSYPFYLEWAYQNLKTGGLVIGDNSLLFGSVYNEELYYDKNSIKAMQDFNSALADDTRFFSIMIPTHEGLSIGIKL